MHDIVVQNRLSYYRLGNYETERIFCKTYCYSEYSGYARFQTADSYFAEKNYEKAKAEYKMVYSEKVGKKYEEDAKYWELNCELNLGKEDSYGESEKFLKEYPQSSYLVNILSIEEKFFLIKSQEAVKEYENLYIASVQNTEKDQTVKDTEIYDKKQKI